MHLQDQRYHEYDKGRHEGCVWEELRGRWLVESKVSEIPPWQHSKHQLITKGAFYSRTICGKRLGNFDYKSIDWLHFMYLESWPIFRLTNS